MTTRPYSDLVFFSSVRVQSFDSSKQEEDIRHFSNFEIFNIIDYFVILITHPTHRT